MACSNASQSFQIEATVTRFEPFDAPVDDSEFVLTFPVGTMVSHGPLGINGVIDDAGKLVPRVRKGPKIPPYVVPAQKGAGFWWLIIGALVITGGVFQFVRSRRA